MRKVTFVALTANCGHPYMGYTYDAVRDRCADCVTTKRLNMQLENAHRAHLLRAAAPSKRQSYYISPNVRAEVYARDEWVCQLCMDPVDSNLHHADLWAPTLDHIVCRSWTDEPDHTPNNLRLAHRWCNAVRGNEQWHGVRPRACRLTATPHPWGMTPAAQGPKGPGGRCLAVQTPELCSTLEVIG